LKEKTILERGLIMATESFDKEFILTDKALQSLAKSMGLTTDEVLKLLGVEFEDEDKI
jgi:uncharacterized protein YidB (DUF937 family)